MGADPFLRDLSAEAGIHVLKVEAILASSILTSFGGQRDQ
jgi:hypothetical protein